MDKSICFFGWKQLQVLQQMTSALLNSSLENVDITKDKKKDLGGIWKSSEKTIFIFATQLIVFCIINFIQV